MEIRKEIEQALERNSVWMLATAEDGHVTARSMSVVHIGLRVFFQTGDGYTKHRQMLANPRVALAHGNIAIEGEARLLGGWAAVPEEIASLYMKKHPGSWAKYAALPGEVVWEVVPTTVRIWQYEGDAAYRIIYDVATDTVERLGLL